MRSRFRLCKHLCGHSALALIDIHQVMIERQVCPAYIKLFPIEVQSYVASSKPPPTPFSSLRPQDVLPVGWRFLQSSNAYSWIPPQLAESNMQGSIVLQSNVTSSTTQIDPTLNNNFLLSQILDDFSEDESSSSSEDDSL
jgi:hypothetical protein